MHNKYNNICFIIAMEAEAKPLIDHFGLIPIQTGWPDYIPMQAFGKNFKNFTFSLITNGHDDRFGIDNIGTQAATLATHLAIDLLKPDLVINAGAAGGFKEKGIDIGDVVIAQGKAYYHDRRIPIPRFKEYGTGAYPLMDQQEIITAFKLKSGNISTGNSFDFTKDDQEVMNDLDISMKDMEAAAIAWVCELAGIPLLILKGITDNVGLNHTSETEFVSNFNTTMEHLKKVCIDLIQFISAS